PQGGRDRNTQTTPTPSTGADQNQNTPNSANAAAIAKLVEANTAEVEIGKMASDKAENPRVKEFADMMVRDHTDAHMKLSALPGGNPAGTKLNAKDQQLKDRLSKVSGAQFDREYMRAMVTDHQADVKLLEQMSGRSTGSSTTGGPDVASVSRE